MAHFCRPQPSRCLHAQAVSQGRVYHRAVDLTSCDLTSCDSQTQSVCLRRQSIRVLGCMGCPQLGGAVVCHLRQGCPRLNSSIPDSWVSGSGFWHAWQHAKCSMQMQAGRLALGTATESVVTQLASRQLKTAGPPEVQTWICFVHLGFISAARVCLAFSLVTLSRGPC